MNKKLFALIVFSALMVLSSMWLSSAEVYNWNDVILNNITNTTDFHAFYSLDDTPYNAFVTNAQETFAGLGVTRVFHTIPISLLYNVQALPYNLTAFNSNYTGVIDYCNLSIQETHNDYSGFLNNVGVVNTTTTFTSYYFNSSASGTITINLQHRDSVVADMICHYTQNENLYVENTLFGRFDTLEGSYECGECKAFTLEQLSHATDTADNITASQLTIFNGVQTLVDWNYRFWLIGFWFLKIALLILAFAMIFITLYWVYHYLKRLASQ